MTTHSFDELTIDVGDGAGDGGDPTLIRVDWRGTSRDRCPERFLVPLFDQLGADAAVRSARLELHFEKLCYFNSATMSALLHIVRNLRERPSFQGFVVVYDPTSKLQRLSFEALRIFDKPRGFLQLRELRPAPGPASGKTA